MNQLSFYLLRWKAFLFPVAGWKQRLREYKAGKTVWEVPGRPTAPKLVPWPIQWIPHRLAESSDLELDQARGFIFLPSVCWESRKATVVGEGVLCCRCGIPLHPDYAHMLTGFDPPYCKRCAWPVFFAKS